MIVDIMISSTVICTSAPKPIPHVYILFLKYGLHTYIFTNLRTQKVLRSRHLFRVLSRVPSANEGHGWSLIREVEKPGRDLAL